MILKKLTISDIVYLSIFCVIIILRVCLNFINVFSYDRELVKIIYEILADFLTLFMVTTSPFCIRFRNYFFAIIWTILSIAFNLTDFRPITIAPLMLLVLFYIIRFIFRTIYKREFIPATLSKSSSYSYFSVIDNRSSEKEDAIFTRIYFFIGFICLILSIFLSAKR